MKKLAAILLTLVMLFSMSFLLEASATSERFLVTTGHVNVRRYPGTDTEIIGVLGAGEEIYPLNLIHTYDGRTWAQIEWKGIDGYISDLHLDYSNYNDTPENVVWNVSLPMRTTGDVYVRREASIDSEAFCIFGKDTQLDVWTFYTSEDGRVWAEIEVVTEEDIMVGYVSTKFLEFLDDWPELGRKMIVTGGRVNVHANAWIDSEDTGTLYEGEVVDVNFYIPTADGRIWASCNMDGEYIGFVSIKYLRIYEVE